MKKVSIYLIKFIIEHKYDDIKDEFQKKYLILNDKIKLCENLFDDKEMYRNNTGKAIYERLKIDKKIGVSLEEIKSYLDAFKKKYEKVKDEEKKNTIKLLNDKYELLFNRYKNIHIKRKSNIENDSNNLIKGNNIELGSNDIMRSVDSEENGKPITEEELEILKHFNMRIEKQDDLLKNLRMKVKNLKEKGKEIGEQIKGFNIPVKKITPKCVIVINDVKSKTEMVNDVIKKIRDPSKMLCDIILIMVLLGLICVLVSIIRKKYL